LKPYELSGEQYNVLRILRGQKGIPLIWVSFRNAWLPKRVTPPVW
jgi:hypothetical protein